MKFLKNKFFKSLSKYYPLGFFLLLIIIFFWKVIVLKQVPLPADLVAGAYFPWLDYKWGFDVGVPVKNAITSDVVSVIYPLRTYLFDLIKNGESPLWNPLMFGGYPLLANLQIAVFSPTSVLYLFLSNTLAWTVQIMLQPLLSMVFSYLLLRNFKLSRVSSALGAALYAFSGFSMIWMEWGAHALTAAFIPLILFLVSKILDEEKVYWSAALSFAVAAQIFSGYPQLFVYTLVAMFVYVMVVYYDKISFFKLFNIALFTTLGVALSSIQLIPAVELLSLSQRVTENLSYDLIYLPWQNLIGFFAPDFFGNHATGNFWGMGNYTNNVGYTGVVALTLALSVITSIKNNRIVKSLFIILFLSLILSLPFPWTKFLYSLNLPGIGASSLTRILILSNLSISSLAAFGIENILKSNYKKMIVSTVVVNTILVALFTYSYINLKNNILFQVSIRNLIFPIMFMAVTFLVSVIGNIYKRMARISTLILIIIAIFELFRFGWKYTPFSDQKLVFPTTPVIDFLSNDRNTFRSHFGEVIPMNMWSSFALSSMSGYDAVYPLTIAKYIAAANSGLATTTPMGRHGSFDNFNSKLFDLVNTKYLLTLKRDKQGNPSQSGSVTKEYATNKFTKVFEDKTVAVIKNNSSLPRIFFVSNWENYESGERIIGRLMEDKFDVRHSIIIEEEFEQFEKSADLPKFNITNVEYKSNEIKLNLTSDKDGFVFVSDTYYPGWDGYVDGNLTKVYKADYAFRAIPVTKGDHKIVFIYNPKSFRIGKTISVSVLIALILLLIYGYKKNR